MSFVLEHSVEIAAPAATVWAVLTDFDAYGQWLFRGAKEPNRLKTKVLVVLHENTPQRRADIEAIRLAWKQATGHQSVLWSRHAVDVSF